MIHLLHPKVLSDLENDARTQAKFHLVMAWFWMVTMVVAPIAWLPHSATALIQLTILEVSLWANFATHLGALSAAQASGKSGRIKA